MKGTRIVQINAINVAWGHVAKGPSFSLLHLLMKPGSCSPPSLSLSGIIVLLAPYVLHVCCWLAAEENCTCSPQIQAVWCFRKGRVHITVCLLRPYESK